MSSSSTALTSPGKYSDRRDTAWWSDNDAYFSVQYFTVTESGTLVYNQGTVFAEPVVKVSLSGDAEITIGATTFSLSGVTGTVTVDTPRLECYKSSTSKNGCMSGEYPTIPVSGAYVSWTGDVSKIVITPNWRIL